jgi:glycosyltransferase involved in cell wall biosynthesis
MKISVFFDKYCPYHQTKDPGQIPIGLCEIGQEAGLITLSKIELADYKPPFSFTAVQLDELHSDQFWKKNDSEVIIGYPLYGENYSPLIEKMKRSGKKVILKLDSDGNIAYPLQRDYFRVPLKERLNLHNILGDLWWRLALESMKRKRHAGVASELIKRFELCDSVIIESPGALENLRFFLSSWGRSDLNIKTTFVPNPIRPEFIESKILTKQKLVVSVGRWDDYQQKNTRLMVKTALDFLKKRPDYSFKIFGKGTELVKHYLASASIEVKERIEVLGFVEDSKILEYLSEAQILFVPSRWESFSIASAEALCMGCSVVGTPLESLRYFSMQGFSGTLASSFDEAAILASLLQDADKWNDGSYNAKRIAEYWRPMLDRKTVAHTIENLVNRN